MTLGPCGGSANAYTSHEHTVYHARVLREDLPVAIDILADILQHSTFDGKELERERQVILQEIAMHQDAPDDLVYDLFHEALFPDQSLGRSILGQPERIEAFTRENVSDYMHTHYHASNLVVSAAGNLSHDTLLPEIESAFSSFPIDTAPPHEATRFVGGEIRQTRDLEQLHLLLGFDAFSFHDPDYLPLQALSVILGGGMSSRLFQEIREKRGLVYSIQCFANCYDDCGLLGIYAATGEDKAEELSQAVSQELLRTAGSITDKELQRARHQLKAHFLMLKESSSGVAEWIGRDILNYGSYRNAKERVEMLDALTAADITRAAERVFSIPTMALAALGPDRQLPSLETIQTQFR